MPGYHPSNLMIGTPDEVIGRIEAARKACSFSEITIDRIQRKAASL
jgi:hypothetical protein